MTNACQDLKEIIRKIQEITDIIEKRNAIRAALEQIIALLPGILPGFPIITGDVDDSALDDWWANLVEAMQGVSCE